MQGERARPARAQVHHPKVAERVADRLRDRILGSELADGDVLPKQEQLIEEFAVSPPSMREALRILETEGLVTIIRGNVGGATVQVPRPETVAYMLSMVLQAKAVELDDVKASLGEMEAMCAAMAARLPDRSALVARLWARIEESQAVLDDDEYVHVGRYFHEDFVAGCGNQTVLAVLGAMERLWSAHVEELTNRTEAIGVFADPNFRQRNLNEHIAIVKAIEKGDAAKASRLVQAHMMGPTQHAFMGTGLVVRSSLVRHSSANGRTHPVP